MNSKTFKDYLLESRQSYSYRVKIAGETSAEFFKQFESELARFDLVKFSEPRRSPIMKTLPGFPDSVTNEELFVVDIEVNYPANTEQLRQIAADLGKSPNNVIVLDARFCDAEEAAASAQEKIASSGEALLNSPYETTTQDQAVAAGEYAKGYQTAALNTEKVKYEFAGKTAEPAKYTSDLPQGTMSPLSKTNPNKLAGE